VARTYTPDEIVHVVRTRRWIVLLPFALGIAAAPLLARFALPLYRSETLIMVVPQRVPDNYVKATVTQSVEDRLPSINDQILSRSRLERIILEMDLYRDLRERMVMEDVVAKMRADVTPTLIGATKQTDATAFRISYVNNNPETARRVTERLASLYIEQNISDRENQAESTSQFLETQLQDAKRRLVEQEKKLEEYRKRNSGQLPTQLAGNLQAIQNANSQLQQLNESTNRALERRLLIERQIADTLAVPLPGQTVPLTADSLAPTTPAQQLEVLRARLAAHLQRYTPDHPEVVSLQRQVAELVARIEQETPLGTSPTTTEKPLTAAEAAQKKRVLDLQAELTVIDHQLKGNRSEEERLKKVIAGYQTRVDALPTRESELVELTRDYETLQTAYSSLLLKREDSLIAANLERRQIGEQFRIIDAASMPQRPFNQIQRLAIMSAGAGVGLILGLLVVAVIELKDSSFRREEEVHARLSLPVLALVPIMSSDRELRALQRRTRLLDVAGTVALVAAVVVLALWQLR
jgi:polysaccharide chain length determinant protein (PEP-CTERM system associated)